MMKGIRANIVNILYCLWVSVCAVLFSCAGADDSPAADVGKPQEEPVYVSFKLSLQRATVAEVSRGAVPDNPFGGELWGDDYVSSEAIAFDDRLLRTSLYISLYESTGGSYVGQIVDLTCIGLSQTSVADTYIFVGALQLADTDISTEELQRKTVKMMVTANVSDDEGMLTGPGLTQTDAGPGSMTYECIGQTEDFNYIPMWGVCTKSLAGIKQGERFDMGQVSLLRAMAKIEVGVNKDNPELEDVSVKSVAVSRVNRKGYVMPGKWNELAETSDLSFAQTLRIPSEAGRAEKRSFGKNAVPDLCFYLPECANAQGDDEIVMTVTYAVGGEVRQGSIHLCPYTDGKPDGAPLWDIVRNHHYWYVITSVGANREDGLRFKVTIEDMEKGGEWTYEY